MTWAILLIFVFIEEKKHFHLALKINFILLGNILQKNGNVMEHY